MEKVNVMVGWDRNYGAHLEIGDGIVVVTGTKLEDVKKEFASALEFHLGGMREAGEEIPVAFQGNYELVYHLNAQALLKHTEGIISRKALARATGINLQQLSHYATGWRNPRPEMQQRIMRGIQEIGQQLMSVSL